MLALVAGCSAAPHPILPAQEGGKVCLSTSVELKTVTCNIDCNVDHYANNPDTQICPEACVCASTVQANDLTGALPSDEFARLVAVASDRSAGANQVVRSQVTSSSFAAKAPAAVSTPKTGASSPVALPNDGEDLYGYYAKTWACKEPFLQSPACLGPPDRNIDVVFSGYGSIAAALEAVMKQGDRCSPEDKVWCEGQIAFLTDSTVPPLSLEEATKQVLSDAATEAKCNRCMGPKAKAKEENKRLQFLTLGGANAEGMVTTAAMDAVEAGLEDVKAAGFDGICFDIELTMGEQDLVEAQERAFAACKAAGLLVMVTTSHSAPYAAGSEGSKIALTESWMNSDDIDIFSPQLYTSGMEESPDFDLTPCREAPSDEPPEKARCTYERLKGMKAKWVPSLCSETHYEATKQFFEDMGIKTHGFVQWYN